MKRWGRLEHRAPRGHAALQMRQGPVIPCRPRSSWPWARSDRFGRRRCRRRRQIPLHPRGAEDPQREPRRLPQARPGGEVLHGQRCRGPTTAASRSRSWGIRQLHADHLSTPAWCGTSCSRTQARPPAMTAGWASRSASGRATPWSYRHRPERQQRWFDRAGNHHSADTVVGRSVGPRPARRPLRYEAEITDPNTFTRPWKMSMNLYKKQGEDAQLKGRSSSATEFVEELLYGALRKSRFRNEVSTNLSDSPSSRQSIKSFLTCTGRRTMNHRRFVPLGRFWGRPARRRCGRHPPSPGPPRLRRRVRRQRARPAARQGRPRWSGSTPTPGSTSPTPPRVQAGRVDGGSRHAQHPVPGRHRPQLAEGRRRHRRPPATRPRTRAAPRSARPTAAT